MSFTEYLSKPNEIQEIIFANPNDVNIFENDKEKLQEVIVKRTSKTHKNDLMRLFK